MAYKNIVITGASSGLGEALAKIYAERGVTLGLLGRNTEKLEALAMYCRARGTEVIIAGVDVCDEAAMTDWLAHFDADHPIDLIIANAGISGGTAGGTESPEQTRRIFDVNVTGVFNTVLPVIAWMQMRKRGHIALISSIAGFRGLGSAPAYCASKAAVRAWGEGLRLELKPHGINVSVVCPGFIKTPMTAVNPYPMPFIMEAEEAALRIKTGIEKNRPRIAFPLPMSIPMWLLSCISPRLADVLVSWLPGKPPQEFKG
jgi:short-subunit dehydrogenase